MSSFSFPLKSFCIQEKKIDINCIIITDSYGDFSFNFATYVEGFF